MRALAIGAILACAPALGGCQAVAISARALIELDKNLPEQEDECPAGDTPRSGCCRICEDGQACGDSCSDSSDSCDMYVGCACDPGEICPERG